MDNFSHKPIRDQSIQSINKSNLVESKVDYPYEEGWLYTGDMIKIDGQMIPHGSGSLTNQMDGRQIRAVWTHGIILTQATINFPNGNVFRGKLNKMRPEGHGQLQTLDGTVFTGVWSKGQLVEGTEKRPNTNEVYKGGFHNL